MQLNKVFECLVDALSCARVQNVQIEPKAVRRTLYVPNIDLRSGIT